MSVGGRIADVGATSQFVKIASIGKYVGQPGVGILVADVRTILQEIDGVGSAVVGDE